jgi:hypothetical protein
MTNAQMAETLLFAVDHNGPPSARFARCAGEYSRHTLGAILLVCTRREIPDE